MPGERKHHSTKMRSCVEKVMAEGKGESSAYAICTAQLQKAGEPIFEGAEMHHLHLLGATGQARTETLEGREYIVVPVVALMEGVIHAVNAATPEFVPLSTLQKAAATWNGRPVVLGHPVNGGKQCSANSPEMLASHGIGTVFKARVEGRKLLCEAWVDKAKAKKLHPEMLARLMDGTSEEVSVGAFVVTDNVAGEWDGKPYKASWLETVGDHLAFLPNGRGACSREMGCGTHRAAMHLVTAEAIVPVPSELPLLACTALEGQSLDERIQAVNAAVAQRWPMKETLPQPVYSGGYAQQVFDDRVIVRVGDDVYSTPYAVEDGKVVLGEATKVKQAWVAARAKYEDCPACKGSGNVGGNPCEACDGEGEIRAAAGARHSSKDQRMIQDVHDYAMALGAVCDRSNYKMLEDKLSPKILRPGDVVHNVCSNKDERVSLKVKAVTRHPTNPFLHRIAFEGNPRDAWVDRSNTYKVTRGTEEFTIRASMASLVVFDESDKKAASRPSRDAAGCGCGGA